MYWRYAGWMGLCLIIALGVGGCASSDPKSRPVAATQKKPVKKVVKVRKGDTLYGLAWKEGLDYRTLARWNGLKSPYTIYPGQLIYFYPRYSQAQPYRPKTRHKPKSTAQRDSKPKSTATKNRGVKPASTTTTKKRTSSKAPSKNQGGLHWIWPVKGKIISHYSTKDPMQGGIRIAGRKGQKIVAAESGEVVYAGNGLVGYGQLIIIKHNNAYLSAYAHNSRLRVREGDKIKKGQHISDMGTSHDGQAALYFEIRKYGKPRNPLAYLPKT